MAFWTSNAKSDAQRGSNRCGLFAFSFFWFSTAATAEGAGV